MPKLKTHKGVVRRVRVTGRGKLLRHRTGRRHLLTRRNPNRMRKLRKPTEVSPVQEALIRRLIPYQT